MTAYSFMMLFKLTLRLDYANYEESILEHVWYMRMKIFIYLYFSLNRNEFGDSIFCSLMHRGM